MRAEKLCDALFIVLDELIERLDELRVHLGQPAAAFDDCRVGGQCCGALGRSQDLLNRLRAANVMAIEKAFEGALFSLLESLKAGPLFEEINRQAGAEIAAQHLDGLGVIFLETSP